MLILKPNNIFKAVNYLKQGKTIVFPTETSYGLGCDAANQKAVDRIFKIKGRAKRKPLLVVVPTVAMAKKYLEWNELLEKISKKYWPGAVTIVGEIINHKSKIINHATNELAKGVVSMDDTLALRVTANPIAKQLTAGLSRPLVATSANIADAGEIYDSKEIIKIFFRRKCQPDILIDAGKLPRRKPSTMVSAVRGELRMIRKGDVKISN